MEINKIPIYATDDVTPVKGFVFYGELFVIAGNGCLLPLQLLTNFPVLRAGRVKNLFVKILGVPVHLPHEGNERVQIGDTVTFQFNGPVVTLKDLYSPITTVNES